MEQELPDKEITRREDIFKFLITRGSSDKYQIKYWDVITLLNVTNTNVCKNEAKKGSLENLNEMRRHRASWRRKHRNPYGEFPSMR